MIYNPYQIDIIQKTKHVKRWWGIHFDYSFDSKAILRVILYILLCTIL